MLSTARDRAFVFCVIAGMFMMLAAVQLVPFRPTSVAGLQETLPTFGATNLMQAQGKAQPILSTGTNTYTLRTYVPIVKSVHAGRR